ncbi:zinc metalloprotease HtpX [bacterium]|nr:zinc metalloprotease HtpX [bacterium]
MATDDVSPERTRAFYKFKEAEQQVQKHHYDHALELAHDALDIDPTFAEVRFWIADLYRRQDKARKASLVYQEILHQDGTNEQAWAALREIDPAAAERLTRLRDIAPDPFVAQRGAAAADDLDDLGGLADEFAEEQPEEELILARDVAVDDLGDVAETGGVQAMLEAEVGSITGVQPAHGSGAEVAGDDLGAEDEAGPPDWLYEEDLKYRDRMAQSRVYTKLLPDIVDFWRDDDKWDTAISGSVHFDAKRHPGVIEVCREVETRLGAPQWNLYVCPERRMVSCITRGNPPTMSLTTGCLNALTHDELLFMVGRFTTMVVAGHVPFIQMTMLTLERSPRTITDVETDMLDLLKDQHAGWDAGVHREDRMKLGQLCHAWQQRAELTADRGGLICCGNLDVACNAIARLTAPDSTAAQTASAQVLAEKFKGQDVGQLAAIPPKEDPVRHEGYALYRVKMLRWWAKTPQGQALLAP